MPEPKTPPAFAFNPDDYRDDIKEFDLTEEEANELLRALWDMMSAIVDLGWGVDTVQLVLPELFEKSSKPD